MTRQYFQGAIELREQLKELAHKSRLERIKEVRLQERKIAQERTKQIRDKINEHKHLKYKAIKDKKSSEAKLQQCRKIVEFENALVHTGDAHRAAREQRNEFIQVQEKLYETEETHHQKAIERMQSALRVIRTHQALQEVEEEEKEKLQQIRHDLRDIEREDARAYQELLESRKRLQSLPEQQEEDRPLIPRSAERVHHRFPHRVQARVIAHTHGNTIFNNASEQEAQTTKSKWNHIMEEMTRKQKVKQRAREAAHVQLKARSALSLEEDLRLLEQTDKLGERMFRLKESGKVVVEDEIVPEKSFEQMFMVSRHLPPPLAPISAQPPRRAPLVVSHQPPQTMREEERERDEASSSSFSEVMSWEDSLGDLPPRMALPSSLAHAPPPASALAPASGPSTAAPSWVRERKGEVRNKVERGEAKAPPARPAPPAPPLSVQEKGGREKAPPSLPSSLPVKLPPPLPPVAEEEASLSLLSSSGPSPSTPPQEHRGRRERGERVVIPPVPLLEEDGGDSSPSPYSPSPASSPLSSPPSSPEKEREERRGERRGEEEAEEESWRERVGREGYGEEEGERRWESSEEREEEKKAQERGEKGEMSSVSSPSSSLSSSLSTSFASLLQLRSQISAQEEKRGREPSPALSPSPSSPPTSLPYRSPLPPSHPSRTPSLAPSSTSLSSIPLRPHSLPSSSSSSSSSSSLSSRSPRAGPPASPPSSSPSFDFAGPLTSHILQQIQGGEGEESEEEEGEGEKERERQRDMEREEESLSSSALDLFYREVRGKTLPLSSSSSSSLSSLPPKPPLSVQPSLLSPPSLSSHPPAAASSTPSTPSSLPSPPVPPPLEEEIASMRERLRRAVEKTSLSPSSTPSSLLSSRPSLPSSSSSLSHTPSQPPSSLLPSSSSPSLPLQVGRAGGRMGLGASITVRVRQVDLLSLSSGSLESEEERGEGRSDTPPRVVGGMGLLSPSLSSTIRREGSSAGERSSAPLSYSSYPLSSLPSSRPRSSLETLSHHPLPSSVSPSSSSSLLSSDLSSH